MPFIQHAGKNILFMHVPKCGGTSVDHWLATISSVQLSTLHNQGFTSSTRCTPQHFTAADMRCLFTDGFFSYSFLFVRNPYTRLESEYRYLLKEKKLHRRISNLWTIPSFGYWVKQELHETCKNPWHLDNHLRPQFEFVYPKSDCFKLEDGLLHGLAKVAAVIDVPPPQPFATLNHTTDMTVETTWTDEARTIVARHFARDFKEFGYAP